MLMEHSMDLVNQPRQQGNKYEVFLSYSRGEDIQKSFCSCLYSSLRKHRISILRDITSIELLQSIVEGCKISIIIFPKNYASSRRCLEELTKIMEFRRPYYQVVLPIFYGALKFIIKNLVFEKHFEVLSKEFHPLKMKC
ncbi:hypothetical protein K1719_036336 [Acacia pycnantha]|nr:hypothetical protein K1719_036336 [Acacia pycnantha]